MQGKIGFEVDMRCASKNIIFQIHRIGREYCDSNKAIEIRSREYYSLHFVKEGRGILKYDDKETEITEGMCFLLYANKKYEYYPQKSNPWKYDWIDFYGNGIREFFFECGFSLDKPYLYYPKNKKFLGELDELINIHNERRTQDICVVAQFFKIISGLHYHSGKTDDLLKKHSIRDGRIRDILVYVNNNCRANITIESIARANHISERYMTKLFVEEIGMTPTDYINAYRISIACDCLQKKEWKIKEIAQWVGYSDEKYFMRQFKKYISMSPTEYRNNYSYEESPYQWLKNKNIDYR